MTERVNRERARKLLETATQLMALARDIEGRDENQDNIASHPQLRSGDAFFIEIARQMYKTRRQRDALVDNPDLFGEPAWDMYLDLYIATHEMRRVSVTSACVASNVPTTTALRWLRLLEEEGIVVRERDEADSRRTNVRLSAMGFERMTRYFRRVAQGQPLVHLSAMG